MAARDVLSKGLVGVFFAVAIYGVFATTLLSLERAAGVGIFVGVTAGVAVAAAVTWVAIHKHDRVACALDRVVRRFERISTTRWVVTCIAAGTLLRVAWVAIVPQVPTSDYRSYLILATSLVERGEYWIGHTCFFRPPGVSLSLAVPLFVFGDGPWVPLVHNLAIFAATVLVVFVLARRVADERVARLSVALLAVWPGSVFLAGLVSKELLSLLLLCATVLLYVSAVDRWRSAGASGRAAAAGLVLGGCVLTQPTAILVPAALLIYELSRGSTVRAIVTRLAIVVSGAVLVVSPWTVRNYLASGKFLLVSANGGHSLWVGNNPDATGGYVSIRGRYSHLDEITYDRMARGWALEWIRNNPGRFLRLAVRKQILYLGDDADGAYTTMKRGLGIDGVRYALAKGVSNAFWMGLLALTLVSVWHLRRSVLLYRPVTLFVMLPLLFQVAMFSVTESGGRHHIAVTGFLAIFAALIVCERDRHGDRDAASSGAIEGAACPGPLPG